MVAAYLPQLHQEVQHRHGQKEPDLQRAATDVLCFSYEELGQRIALRWNMPDTVVRAMSSSAPRAGRGPQILLHGVASFAQGITEAMHHPVPSKIASRLEEVRLTHKEVSRFTPSQLTALMNESLADLKEVWLAAALPTDVTQLAFKVSHALEQTAKLGPAIVALPAPAPVEAAPPEPTSDGAPAEVAEESIFLPWLQTLRQAVTSGEPPDSIVRKALESLVSGGAQRAVLAVPESNGRLISARVGVGEEIGAFLRQFRYPADAHTNPVAFALARQKELFLDPEAGSHGVFVQRMGLRGAVIIPVLVNEEPQACLYADWKEGEGISADDRVHIREIRDLVAQAMAAQQEQLAIAV